MDLNITYYIAEHGWSTCWINKRDKIYEMSITHIFLEDPIEECIKSLIEIINGKKSTEFKWYGEPGGERITINEISDQQHKVYVNIESFSEGIDQEIKSFAKGIDFTIKKNILVTMFYYEFKKIFELLKDKHYKENRSHNFPFDSFRRFEKVALEYIN